MTKHNTSARPHVRTSAPVKVVYIIDDLGLGGAQRQLVELVKALPADRIAPHVISLSTEKTHYAQAIRDAGIPLTLIAQHGKWSWQTLWRLMRAIRRSRPAIVQTWLFTADLYGRLAAWLTGVPVIISAVRSVEPWKPAHYVAADRLLRRVTDAFTVNAAAIGEILAAREHVKPSRISTIYNGINLEAFDPAQTDGAIRRHLGLNGRHRLAGVIGRLGPEKDHETFLRAAALVARDVPQARFLIVGDGPLKGTLRRLVRSLGLAAQVHFLESQSDIAPVFAALDLVVVSSRYEGCCNVLLEGMAMGKPVVATAVGGNPELVVEGTTGLLVPAAEPNTLAQAVSRLLQDPVRAQAMGRAARRRVESDFSRSRMIDETLALYQRLQKGRS